MRLRLPGFAGPSFVLVGLLLALASCGDSPEPAGSKGPPVLETRDGLASFYGSRFHGEETASGRSFDTNEMVAAHPTYPFGTRLRVTRTDDDRAVTVNVVDRGPTDDNVREGVIIDLSLRAARELGFVEDGRIRVRVDVLDWGQESPDEPSSR